MSDIEEVRKKVDAALKHRADGSKNYLIDEPKRKDRAARPDDASAKAGQSSVRLSTRFTPVSMNWKALPAKRSEHRTRGCGWRKKCIVGGREDTGRTELTTNSRRASRWPMIHTTKQKPANRAAKNLSATYKPGRCSVPRVTQLRCARTYD